MLPRHIKWLNICSLVAFYNHKLWGTQAVNGGRATGMRGQNDRNWRTEGRVQTLNSPPRSWPPIRTQVFDNHTFQSYHVALLFKQKSYFTKQFKTENNIEENTNDENNVCPPIRPLVHLVHSSVYPISIRPSFLSVSPPSIRPSVLQSIDPFIRLFIRYPSFCSDQLPTDN